MSPHRVRGAASRLATPAAVAVLAALGSLAPGCLTADAASHNLDAVMAPSHRFHYVADIQSGWRAFMRQFVDPTMLDPDSPLAARAQPKVVKDPTDVALDNLLALADTRTFRNDDHRRAEQARHFARYAAYSPSQLCRERALLELGELAVELELETPVIERPVGASAAELSELLTGFIAALRPMLSPQRATETQRRDFVAACELLASRPHDIESGRRLLAVIGGFTSERRLGREGFQPLARLARQVEVAVVGQALARALDDPVPYVRAAAYRANFQAYGDLFLEEALTSIALYDGTPDSAERRTQRLGLPAVRPHEEALIVTTLELVREHGLPRRARGDTLEAYRARYVTLLLLAQIAFDFSTYGDRSRTAAMLTLSEVSGSGLASLREEDWDRWWRGWRVRAQADIERLQNESAAPPDAEGP